MPRTATRTATPIAATDSLRPRGWDEFIGQGHAKDLLRMIAAGSKAQKSNMPHLLLSGPPGTGKTSLAELVSRDSGQPITLLQGGEIETPQVLISRALAIPERGALFVDEVHSAHPQALELLYEVMEPAEAKSYAASRMKRFSIIAATTEPGSLPRPFRDRCLSVELGYYSVNELGLIGFGMATRLGTSVAGDAMHILADAAHGTPRHMARMLEVAKHYLAANRKTKLDGVGALAVLNLMGLDRRGYTRTQREYMRRLALLYNGGPASQATLASGLGVDPKSLSKEVEPALIRAGFLAIGSRGRSMTGDGRIYVEHLDKENG